MTKQRTAVEQTTLSRVPFNSSVYERINFEWIIITRLFSFHLFSFSLRVAHSFSVQRSHSSKISAVFLLTYVYKIYGGWFFHIFITKGLLKVSV